ncbi:MAG TPA: UDP-N-acetylmuramoyl-L-alanyl-D-glutamate--2,6-diaminopimelate ligase [Trueperaceae bacterium]|nr:UDP-N-acetylmuramoyl-L-alanyl-D-glutamate--2,6-diaminopimelate ligase [Trueperaceae bacterium]
MRLSELLADALGVRLAGTGDPEVTSVVQRHDRARPGALFVARKGTRFDAHAYIEAAIAAGAVAVVGEAELPSPLPGHGVPYLRVADARLALPQLAAAFYRHPARGLTVLGVTGTDGKTTTATLLHHLLGARRPAALISTAGILLGEERVPLEGHFTTPEATEVQALLARCRDAGLRDVVLESSSHGFSLHRLDAIPYAVGVWTNLSPEHLDHHGDLEAYRDAKATLMRRSLVSVLNRDEPDFAYFAAAARRVVSYGEGAGADVRLEGVTSDPGGVAFVATSGNERVAARLPVPGRFNAWNALAALAAAREVGLPLAVGAARLATFPGVPGRMQLLQREPFAVIVDFAHTPPALAKALEAVTPAPPGRVLVVIGSAGERDPGKRAPLGEVAARHAGKAFFTEEDARSEDVGAILQAMAAGARRAGAREGEDFLLLPDRREAIRRALAEARPGDVVLLAGKGHEATLERAAETLPWDEAGEARRWL